MLLSRDAAYAARTAVTVTEISTTIRGIASEVPLGPQDGLPRPCVANADNLVTIPKVWLQARIAALSSQKLAALEAAVMFSLGMTKVK